MENSGTAESGSNSIRPIQDGISTSTEFVFVDQTPNSPESRAVNRLKVRSQARSHAAKIFRKKHKTGQRNESAKVKTLVPNEPHYHDYEFLSYPSGCPPSFPELPTVVGSNSNYYTYDFASGDASAIPGESPPIEGIFTGSSSFSEASGAAPYASLSPHPVENLELYSKARRSSINSIGRRLRERGGNMVPIVRQSRNGMLPSPCELLGAGKVDPFLSYPIERLSPNMHELVDFLMTYELPGAFPDDHPQHGPNAVNSVAKAWFSTGLESPFFLNILLFSACIQRDILRASAINTTSTQALSYKVKAIQQLNEVLANGEKAVTDQVILTIIGVMGHEALNITEEEMKPFNSPLKNAGLLHIYGGLKHVPGHLSAITKLLALRGGIEPFTLPGLADCLILTEICAVLNSSFYLKPVFPPLLHHEPYISAVKAWAESPWRSAQALGRGFQLLPDIGITATMLEVFNSMAAITMAIDHYLHGDPAGLTLGQIVRTRNGVQKKLLLLPTAQDLHININTGSSSNPNLYECFRLTALIFSIAVIYPIPNTYAVLQTLVRDLKDAIEVIDIESCGTQCSEVLLWMLVLGGIAALGKPERDWFASQLKFVGVEWLKLDWEGVEHIMRTLLWLDSACSSGGRQLWDVVVKIPG